MSLLTIIQNVTNETGLGEQPTTVIGNNDTYVRKVLSLLNKVGKELLTMHDWQVLQKEQTFITNGSGSYTRASVFVDGDFTRYANNTDWDRTNRRKMILVTPEEWQYLESGITVVAGINHYYREMGNSILVAPDAGTDTVVFEYISNQWITDSTGATPKAAFTNDEDLTRFPEFLMELGLKYRLKAGDGLPAAVEREEYMTERERLIAVETPKRVLSPRRSTRRLFNIPDTGFGQ